MTFQPWLFALLLFICYLCSLFLPVSSKEDTPNLLSAPDESRCFSPKCHSIVINHERDAAVLLVHGFPATPQTWSYLAGRLDEAGYDVYAPLIPGFGTDPHDLDHETFSQWYAYIKQYYLNLRKQYKKVYVVAHSMGGSITIRLAEECHDMDGIVTISAPVVYNSLNDGIITNFALPLARVLRHFRPSFNTWTKDFNPHLHADGHEDWTGYTGLLVRAGASFIASLPAIRKNLNSITVPYLAIHDHRDRTVPVGNLAIIGRESGATTKETHIKRGWLHSYHCLPMYHSIQGELADSIIAFFR